jgi:hypothetical protein
MPIPDLLRQIAAGADSTQLTPALHHFLVPAARNEWAELLRTTQSWTGLGCESVVAQKVIRLGDGVQRICYARGSQASGGALVSAYYMVNGRVGDIDFYVF